MQSSTASDASASLASVQVKQVLDSLVAEGPEIGLQVAAYLNGELVVDAWAGLAERSNGKPVDGDTLFMLSSTTKGVTATCAAVLEDGPPGPPEYDQRMVGEPAGSHVAQWFNRREIQQAAIPGSGGIMSARGLARMYAMLANGGELDGVRILSPASIRRAAELQSYELDEIYRVRIRRALGYRVGPDSGPGAGPNAFGHVGGGGSFGYADPDRNFAIAMAKNYFAYNSGTPMLRRSGLVVAAAVLSALQLEDQRDSDSPSLRIWRRTSPG